MEKELLSQWGGGVSQDDEVEVRKNVLSKEGMEVCRATSVDNPFWQER